MTDFVIPCDTFVRLSNVIAQPSDNHDEWFQSIRIDNGQAVATDRRIMSIENIGGAPGIVHLIADPTLVAQCRAEAPFSSKLTITVTEALKFAVAKTTLGYVHPGNCAVWSDTPRDAFDRWRSVVMSAKEGGAKSSDGMFWSADDIARLAAASPSGRVVFAENIDAMRPTLMRDIHDYEWLGVFNPFSADEHYSPATVPSWMTA